MIITNQEPDDEALAAEALDVGKKNNAIALTEAFNQKCKTNQLDFFDNGYFCLDGERLDDVVIRDCRVGDRLWKYESRTVLPNGGVRYVFFLAVEQALQMLADDFEPLLVIACCRG